MESNGSWKAAENIEKMHRRYEGVTSGANEKLFLADKHYLKSERNERGGTYTTSETDNCFRYNKILLIDT